MRNQNQLTPRELLGRDQAQRDRQRRDANPLRRTFAPSVPREPDEPEEEPHQ